eukprot:gene31867-38532_t
MKAVGHPNQQKRSSALTWKALALCMLLTVIPWAVYVNYHPQLNSAKISADNQATSTDSAHKLGQLRDSSTNFIVPSTPTSAAGAVKVPQSSNPVSQQLPVLGPVPTDGTKPLFDMQHKGTDAVFALACNYPKIYYQRFVGSLRKFGYQEDIVLA